MGETVSRQTQVDPDAWNVKTVGEATTPAVIVVPESQKPTLRPRARYEDGTASAGGTTPPGYTAVAGQPAPPLPTSTQAQASVQTAAAYTAVAYNAGPPTNTVSAATTEQNYLTKFNTRLDNYQPPLTNEQKQWVRFLQRVPGANIPAGKDVTLIKKALTDITQAAITDTRLLGGVPPDWEPPTADPKAFGNGYVAAFELALQQKLAGLPKATADATAAKMRFAFYHPELADSATLEAFKNAGLKSAIMSNLNSVGLIVPDDWAPSAKSFDDTVGAMRDMSFDDELDNLVDSDGVPTDPAFKAYINSKTSSMTPADKASFIEQTLRTLKTLHYHPETAVSNKGELSALVTQLEGQAYKDIAGKYGLPSTMPAGWPKPDVEIFDAAVTSDYQFICEQKMQRFLDSASPKLSDADKQALRNYMNDPTTKVSDYIKGIAEGIKLDAKTEIQKSYGLSGWQPVGPSVWTGDKTILNGLLQAQEMVKTARSYIEALPDSPEKMVMLNYLKLIGEAINKLQQQIFEIQARDAAKGKDYSSAVSDASMNKLEKYKQNIEEQHKKLAEAKSKQDKAAKFSSVMKILGPIIIAVSIVITIATAGAFGGVATLIILAMTGLMIADTAGVKNSEGQNATQQMFSGIGKMFGGSRTGEIIGAIFLIILVVGVTRGAGGSEMGVIMASTQVFASSDVVRKLSLAWGASEETAMYIGLGVTAAVIVASIGKTWGQTAAEGSSEVGDLLLDGYKNSMQAAQSLEHQILALGELTAQNLATHAVLQVQRMANYLKAVMYYTAFMFVTDPAKAFEIPLKSMQVGNGAMGYENARYEYIAAGIKGQVEMLKSQLEANDVSADAVIERLQLLIKGIQKILEAIVAMLKGGEDLQKKKYEDVRIDFAV